MGPVCSLSVSARDSIEATATSTNLPSGICENSFPRCKSFFGFSKLFSDFLRPIFSASLINWAVLTYSKYSTVFQLYLNEHCKLRSLFRLYLIIISNLHHVYNSYPSFLTLICLQPSCKPHLYFILHTTKMFSHTTSTQG